MGSRPSFRGYGMSEGSNLDARTIVCLFIFRMDTDFEEGLNVARFPQCERSYSCSLQWKSKRPYNSARPILLESFIVFRHILRGSSLVESLKEVPHSLDTPITLWCIFKYSVSGKSVLPHMATNRNDEFSSFDSSPITMANFLLHLP